MMSLAHQTRIAVQIVVEDETGRVANLVLALTLLITLLLRLGQVIGDVVWVVNELVEELSWLSKVLVIGVRAWLYGFGVPL